MGPRPQQCPRHTAAPLALSKKVLQEGPLTMKAGGSEWGGGDHNEALPLTKKLWWWWWWGEGSLGGGGCVGGLKQQSVQDSQCDRLESCRRLGWGFNPQALGPSYLTAGNLTRRAGREGEGERPAKRRASLENKSCPESSALSTGFILVFVGRCRTLLEKNLASNSDS